MPAWRRFDRQDWYGYAGCEPFADGSEPLIAGLEVVDDDGLAWDAVAVHDGQGLFVQWFEGECGCAEDCPGACPCVVEREVAFMGGEAAAVAAALPSQVSTAVLRAARAVEVL
jgi:hypothetical protein